MEKRLAVVARPEDVIHPLLLDVGLLAVVADLPPPLEDIVAVLDDVVVGLRGCVEVRLGGELLPQRRGGYLAEGSPHSSEGEGFGDPAVALRASRRVDVVVDRAGVRSRSRTRDRV